MATPDNQKFRNGGKTLVSDNQKFRNGGKTLVSGP